MAGNRERFDAAVKAGNDATWDENWNKAAEAFMVAVREFPDNVMACNSLGFALFQLGRLEDALKVYMQAHRIDQNDAVSLEKSADVLERLGRSQEAARQYLAVAELYLAQHDLEKAIDNWEHATKITPGLVKVHQRLAQAYERTGQKADAINQYLLLAYNFQQAGNQQVALQALERALRIDAREPAVLNAITAVRANRPLSPNVAVAKANGKSEEPEDEFGVNYGVADADERGPIGEAVESSMEKLATFVFESGLLDLAGTSAIQGVEMHRAGIREEAITAYKRAEGAGMRQAPLFMNLGTLLLDESQWDDAIKYFQQVSGDNVMTAGAAHGLSLAYIGKGEWRQAVKGLINTLRLIDMSLAMDDEEQATLADVYSRLGTLASKATDQTLQPLALKFASRLTGVDWKRRVTQTRTQLEEVISQGGSDAANILESVAQSDEVIDAMGKIDDYIGQKRYNLAMHEAHHVLLKSPDFLAAHLRIAHILMDLNQIEKAIDKYNLIVQTYLVRGDETKAADVLNQALKVAPADLNLRTSLISMLEKQERWNDVIDQYVQMADVYRDVADLGSARTTLEQATKLAQRVGASQDRVLQIMHSQGELDLERLELRGAMRTYQKIAEMSPEDAKARRQLVELNYRLNNAVAGTQELDKLLQIYAKQRRGDLILQVLEELTREYDRDMGLYSRLGAVYQQMNRLPDALKQLEKLSQLQLDAGLHEEAKKTVRRILSLNPPNGAHYQQMLQQLGG